MGLVTYEYLMWGNCNNNCAFCWQKKKADPNVLLNDTEKIKSINKFIELVNKIPEYSDVLMVGGEVFGGNSAEVSDKLNEAFCLMADRCKNNLTRYFYVNTNLIYEDLIDIHNLLRAFKGIEDRIKFTTSYDIHGRYEKTIDFFAKELVDGKMVHKSIFPSKDLFFKNIKEITSTYPELNVVVNTIMTRFLYDEYLVKKTYNMKEFIRETGCKYVHLLPLIPLNPKDKFNIDWRDIHALLLRADQEFPGYLEDYVINFDFNQEKILYEYHKDVDDFVECTAEYSECGHNVNFKKVVPFDPQCFICNLKETFLV